MIENEPSTRSWRVPVALAFCAIACGAWLLGTGNEISVWSDFRRDVIVRDGYTLDQISDIRFYDTAPYSIWMPSDVFVWESLRRGEAPLWDRSQAGGYSPLLNLQNGVMHPLRWMTVIVPREFAPSALVILVLLSLSVGTFLMLERGFGFSELSALAGALTIVLSGYVLSTIHFSGVVIPLAHVPWIVWAFSTWVTNRSVASASFLAFVVAMLALSGHPLMIVVALIVSGALLLHLALDTGGLRTLLAGACIAFVGFLATAIVTLPMVVNLDQLWSYKHTTEEGMSYARVARVDMADALWAMATWMPYEGDFIDGGPIVFHLGLVASALMLWGLVLLVRQRRSAWLAGLVIVGWILSVPADLVVRIVEGTPLGYFKPWYLMFLFVLPATIAIATGFDRAVRTVPSRLRVATAIALLVGIVLPGLRPVGEVLRPRQMMKVASPAIDHLSTEREPFRVVGLTGQTHAPNVGTLTGIDDVRFSSPVHPRRYHDWYRIAVPGSQHAFPTITMVEDVSSPLFGAFNVKYVLRSTVPGHDIQSFLPRVGDRPSRGYALDPVPDDERYPLVRDFGSVQIYETRHAHPRAHFAEEIVLVDGPDEARHRLAGLDATGVEVVEAPADHPVRSVDPAAAADQVVLDYPSMRRVSITTRAAGPRLLVLHDSWARGWRATVDGVRADILPTNLISRGVVVPAGEHRVEMSFTPEGTWIGALISVVAIAGFPFLAAAMGGLMEPK